MGVCAAVAIACSSFGTSDSEPQPELPADSGVPDAVVVPEGGEAPDASPADAGASGFDLAPRPACPRPAEAKKCVPPKTCKPIELYRPSEPQHPFGIVVDARHVYWLSLPSGSDGYNGNGPATLRRLDRATKQVVELARDQTDATELVAYGPHLYWLARSGGGSFELRTMRKDAAACSGPTCAPIMVVAQGLPRALRVAMPSPDTIFVGEENGGVMRVPLSSGIVSQAGTTSLFPGLAAGNGEVFASGVKTITVQRFGEGGSIGTLGMLEPRDSGVGWVGAAYLATDCASVFALASDHTIQALATTADGGAFQPFGAVPVVDVYTITSDARFAYVGAANSGGLYAVDLKTAQQTTKIANGSVWRLDVTDDGIVFGEHGGSPNDSAAGAIFLIEK